MDRLKEIAKNLDSKDELSIYRNKFILPKNQVYLDGNSLGVLAKDVLDNVNYTIKEEWGNNLISSWNKSCLLYTSPSPRDRQKSRMPSSA